MNYPLDSETKKHPVLLFDGVCNLCNSSVQWIIRHDKKEIFRFAALQSDTGKKLVSDVGLSPDLMNTVVLIDGEKVYTRSDTVLQIFHHLGGVWRLFRIFRFVPRVIRNSVYSFIASHRYQWFGRKSACWLPTPKLNARFLDQEKSGQTS